jgi:hypothetical protein
MILVSLEGALGKISVTSVRNPKQTLQIDTSPPPSKNADGKTTGSASQSRTAIGVQNVSIMAGLTREHTECLSDHI